VIEDEINDLTNAIKKLQASLATSSTAAPAGGSAPGAAASAMKEKFELRELISEVFQLHLKVRIILLLPPSMLLFLLLTLNVLET
jgi:hypothetical protein